MNLRIVPEIWRAWRVGGYSCTVTEDVPGMLKEIEAGEVDVVLLDVSLTPVGRATCQRRRTLPNLEKEVAPAIAGPAGHRAHTISGDRERFLQASGAYGYLEKPAYVSAVLAERARQLTE